MSVVRCVIMSGMTLKRVLMVSTVLISIISCGGNTSGPASVTVAPNDRSSSVTTNQSINQILAKSHLTCEKGDDCPEALGLLVGIEDGKAYRCTAFALENGLIYTNAHCVPAHLQGKSNIGCSSEIGFVFNINGSTHRVSCERIVTSSDLSGESPGIQDVAVIKVKLPQSLKKFKSSLRSRYSGERVTVARVNPVGNWNGIVAKSNCSLKMNTFFGEFFDGPQSPAINTLGCETVAGNSGSPILDKNGYVLGIHQSSLKDKSDLGQKLLAYFNTGSFSSLGTGTNLSCLCDKEGIAQSCDGLPKSCTDLEFSGSDRRRSVLIEKEVYKRSGAAAAGIMTREGRSLPSYIRWEVAYGHRVNTVEGEDALNVNLMVAPNCLESERLLRSEMSKDESDFRNTTHSLEVLAPHCQVNFEFNSLFDFTKAVIDESSCKSARMILYLRKVNNQWEGEAQYVDDSISSSERPYAYNFKLPACS